MRSPPWLAACLLVVSCTVNTANLNVTVPDDAGETGTGGHTSGSGGASATGGSGGDDCPRCAPTGGATGSGGVLATGGVVGTGGHTEAGGRIGSGGQSGAAGQVGAAGQPGGGGQSAAGGQSGQTGIAGQTGSGGQPGTGGQISTGGESGSGGTGGQLGTGGHLGTGGGPGRSCSQLESDYATALTAAKACAIGAGLQCRQLADTSIACPGCWVYVNDTTELAALKAQWTSSGCSLSHGVCPAIACIVPSPASCVSNAVIRPPVGPNTAGTCSSPQFGGP